MHHLNQGNGIPFWFMYLVYHLNHIFILLFYFALIYMILLVVYGILLSLSWHNVEDTLILCADLFVSVWCGDMPMCHCSIVVKCQIGLWDSKMSRGPFAMWLFFCNQGMSVCVIGLCIICEIEMSQLCLTSVNLNEVTHYIYIYISGQIWLVYLYCSQSWFILPILTNYLKIDEFNYLQIIYIVIVTNMGHGWL